MTYRHTQNRIRRVCRILGILLIAFYAVIRLHGFLLNYGSSKSFSLSAEPMSQTEATPDFSLWDSKRIHAYKESLLKYFDPPLAILQIAKIRVRVAVFNGTDEHILNRGVGRIKGTGKMGETGNIGIAGHRDGFFRGLKDVVQGDEIQLITKNTIYKYKVDEILIVYPKDVYVLNPGPKPSVTLVSCYPFYFIGNAPQRYIVKASLQQSQSLTTAKNQ